MSDDRMQVEAQQLLLELRRSYAPTPEDAQRVLAATQRALLTAAYPSPKSTSGLRTWSGSKLALGAACIAVVFGAIGYVVGARTARPLPAVSAALHSDAGAPAARSAPPPAAASPAPNSAPAPASDREPAAPPANARGPIRAKRSVPAPSAPTDPQPADGAPDSLEMELRLLRSVELALREKRPREALSLLDELDRKVPAGKLLEERSATFVVARCAIGLGSRAALLREFIGEHPDSVYRQRVEQSCGP